jgi:hypothetical protein
MRVMDSPWMAIRKALLKISSPAALYWLARFSVWNCFAFVAGQHATKIHGYLSAAAVPAVAHKHPVSALRIYTT